VKTIPLSLILLGATSLFALAAVDVGTSEAEPTPVGDAAEASSELIAVPPPPFTEGIFPCSQCHVEGLDVDTTRRELAFHDDIVFEHDAENRWCLDCHDATNRDVLHLADGRLVTFAESYRLCGQCHGPQLKNWRAGDHGKRTGSWSGKKEYLLCVHCHNPHSPSIKPVEPLPPPLKQENIR